MAKPNASRKANTPAPRQSLAATHPANYVQAAAKAMPPPKTRVQKPEKTLTKSSSRYPTPSPSPPKSTAAQDSHVEPPLAAAKASRKAATPIEQMPGLPWQEHTDPTLSTSDNPPYWSRNNTVLKSDTDITYGSVVSATWVIGLPFGSMVEAAHYYPSEERLERDR